MAGSNTAVIIPAGDAFMDASTYYDPFEYISPDAEDFRIALSTGNPHSFISAAVKIPNSGPHNVCGMGYFNAVELHRFLIMSQEYMRTEESRWHYLLNTKGVREILENYRPSANDIISLKDDIPFNAAIDLVGAKRMPTNYREVLGEAVISELILRAQQRAYRR